MRITLLVVEAHLLVSLCSHGGVGKSPHAQMWEGGWTVRKLLLPDNSGIFLVL